MRIATLLGLVVPLLVAGCDLPLCKRNPALCDVGSSTHGGSSDTGDSETGPGDTDPAETGTGGPGFCGGIAGFPCPDDLVCVDDPSDDCDPRAGGADCGGICVPPTEQSCEELTAAFAAETQEIRSCDDDEQCGQVLTGTSCGCTRDWVARIDADLTEWESLRDAAEPAGCSLGTGSGCDCPRTDGFVCESGTCAWNYL